MLSTSGWVSKLWCVHKRILLYNKKERTIATYDNMDASQNYYAQWKKLGKIEYVLYESVYIKF